MTRTPPPAHRITRERRWLAAIVCGMLLGAAYAGAGAEHALAHGGISAQPAVRAGRQVVITFDDLPVVSRGATDLAHFERVTRDLVAAISRHRVPAIGFVNEGQLASSGTPDPARVALLQQWIDAGLELGNHSYSHWDLHATPLDRFKQDVLRGAEVTRKLMAGAGKRSRYFRHPFLHTGRDAGTRASFESFLAENGYTVAPVTFDNYDYLFAAAYDIAVVSGDAPGRQKIADTYLDYMTRVVSYYEQQSQTLMGREFPQILLLHANDLNARTFDALAVMLRGRGYEFTTLDEALKDPVYQSRDEFYGPGGITWIHRWALTQGKRGAAFAGEPTVPQWIELAAGARAQ